MDGKPHDPVLTMGRWLEALVGASRELLEVIVDSAVPAHLKHMSQNRFQSPSRSYGVP